jgi:3alpha(or 20beta)-hydroxysteroid dehydrogenase
MGAAHARAFVSEGARVILGDIMEKEGTSLAEELGSSAAFVNLDVTDPSSWTEALSLASGRFGPVNILVNNAGVAGPFARTADLEPEAYHRILNVDLHGVFYGMHAAIPGMVAVGGGAIVNISSTAGFSHAGTPNIAYTAAKWAVRGISKAAAVEYASAGIRINSVHLGAIVTPMVANGLDDAAREATVAANHLHSLHDYRWGVGSLRGHTSFCGNRDFTFVHCIWRHCCT